MRAIGIIPARMASTRFPGKPLAPIAGRAMLRRVYDAVRAARVIEPYYIATPDAEIEGYCRENKLNYILTRSDCRNGTERCYDAMRQLAMRDPDDIVINIQGDEPLVRPESLDELARQFIDPRVKIASLYYMPKTNSGVVDPNVVKVLVGDNSTALAFTRRVTAPTLWSLYGRHVGVYGYRRDELSKIVNLSPSSDLEQMAWMRARYEVRMVRIDYETVGVDTLEDVADAEIVLRERL
jgi:3-deoxy-manno-octulosonate cytidylyltransferase (CMP-KDO synthetase)